jgi:hypothetical protein
VVDSLPVPQRASVDELSKSESVGVDVGRVGNDERGRAVLEYGFLLVSLSMQRVNFP